MSTDPGISFNGKLVKSHEDVANFSISPKDAEELVSLCQKRADKQVILFNYWLHRFFKSITFALNSSVAKSYLR
jgi:hypothetical protein